MSNFTKLLEEVLGGTKTAQEVLVEESIPSYNMPCSSLTRNDGNYEEERKKKAYDEAPAKMAAIRKAKEIGQKIIQGLFDEVSAEFPDEDDMKKLALTRKLLNGFSLWDSFKKFAEDMGYVDPSDVGIYETKKD